MPAIATRTRYARHRQRKAEAFRVSSLVGREIPPLNLKAIDWKRRLACKFDLERYGFEYMPQVFKQPAGKDHRRCIAKMERCSLEGGSFAIAMPRAGGKTAWCRADIEWSIGYGHRRFPFFIGSSDDKAKESLEAIKSLAFSSATMLQDFPELLHPIKFLGRSSGHLTKGQTYHGFSTHIEWGADNVRFPSLLLNDEEAKPFLDNDPGFLREWIVGNERYWLAASAGSLIYTAGITASIRGPNLAHPVTGEFMRPDLVLPDDVQKDQGAESPATCDKIIRLIEGAIMGLAGPGEAMAIVMPCTVIREGDVADTFLDRNKKPDFQGERCQMVTRWPDGITDHEITADTEAGRLWIKYGELRRDSLQQFGDIRLATEFYKANRAAMDEGFEVSWPQRFTGGKKYGENREISAQQHAMNLRFKSPETFPAEYQNRPRSLDTGAPIITSAALAERISPIERAECAADTHCIVTFIDVQNEVLLSSTLAVNQEFTGGFIDRGTWPPVPTRYFTRNQTEGWGLLTREFFSKYPEQRSKATKTEGGKLRAPLEAKIYHAVRSYIEELLEREYARADIQGSPLRHTKIIVDARWGKASDAIKRVVRDLRRNDVVYSMGQAISPAHKQYEEYTRTPGWLFEDQVHPGLQEVKWIWRPGPDGAYYLSMDINRLKTFLFSRFGCPIGARGSLTLFKAKPADLEMFCDQVAASEYPEPVTARGRTKDMWQPRDGKPDNDYLDCCAGAIAGASWCGARLQVDHDAARPQTPKGKRLKLRDIWRKKRGS
ncbi:MAG: terminase gpA endonuclease subunit [Pirellulales bacterium]